MKKLFVLTMNTLIQNFKVYGMTMHYVMSDEITAALVKREVPA